MEQVHEKEWLYPKLESLQNKEGNVTPFNSYGETMTLQTADLSNDFVQSNTNHVTQEHKQKQEQEHGEKQEQVFVKKLSPVSALPLESNDYVVQQTLESEQNITGKTMSPKQVGQPINESLMSHSTVDQIHEPTLSPGIVAQLNEPTLNHDTLADNIAVQELE